MGTLFLVARMAGRRLAIDAEQVDAVVDLGRVVPTPLAELQVLGVTALRSRVVTVIDPARALLLDDGWCDTPERAVITTIAGHCYAVVTEAVEDVRPLELLPPAGGLAMSSAWAGVGRGLAECDGEALLIVDLAAVIAGASAQQSFAA